MEIENKIQWEKPDYKNEFGRVNSKGIDRLSFDGGGETGDIIVRKERNGMKILFYVYRIEKIGQLTRGIDTLTRKEAIDEPKKLKGKEESVKAQEK